MEEVVEGVTDEVDKQAATGKAAIDMSQLQTDTVYRVDANKYLIAKEDTETKGKYQFNIYYSNENSLPQNDFVIQGKEGDSPVMDWDKLFGTKAESKDSYDWKLVDEFGITAKKDQELRSFLIESKKFTRFEVASPEIANSLRGYIGVPGARDIDNDVLSFVADIPDLYLATVGSDVGGIRKKLIAGRQDADGNPEQPLYVFNAGKWTQDTVDANLLNPVAIKNAAGMVEQLPLKNFLREYVKQAGANGLKALKASDSLGDIGYILENLQLKPSQPEPLLPKVISNIVDTPKLILGKLEDSGKLVAGYESGGEVEFFVFENKQWNKQGIDRSKLAEIRVGEKPEMQTYLNNFLAEANIEGVKSIKDDLPKEFAKASSFFDVMFGKQFMLDPDFIGKSPQMLNYFNFEISEKLTPQIKDVKLENEEDDLSIKNQQLVNQSLENSLRWDKRNEEAYQQRQQQQQQNQQNKMAITGDIQVSFLAGLAGLVGLGSLLHQGSKKEGEAQASSWQEKVLPAGIAIGGLGLAAYMLTKGGGKSK